MHGLNPHAVPYVPKKIIEEEVETKEENDAEIQNEQHHKGKRFPESSDECKEGWKFPPKRNVATKVQDHRCMHSDENNNLYEILADNEVKEKMLEPRCTDNAVTNDALKMKRTCKTRLHDVNNMKMEDVDNVIKMFVEKDKKSMALKTREVKNDENKADVDNTYEKLNLEMHDTKQKNQELRKANRVLKIKLKN